MKLRTFILTYITIISLSVVSCYDESEFNDTNFSFESLTTEILIEKQELIANSIDKSKVRIYFDSIQNLENFHFIGKLKNATFLTSKSDTITLSPNIEQGDTPRKFIEFQVVAGLIVEDIELTMNINDYVKTIMFKVDRSFPESIELSPTPIVFDRKRKENIDIQIILRTDNGKISNSTDLILSAHDTIDNEIGNFISNCNDFQQSDSCNAKYNIWPDTSYVGPIRITATTNGQNNTIIETINLYTTN